MAELDPRFIVTQDLDSYFVDKDSGLPLAGGILTFYEDNARTVKKPVYQLTGAPGSYTYTQLPNPIELSAVGTVQNASGDNIAIYYFPFDGTPNTSQGELELYYVTCTNSAGTDQFTREAWPNTSLSDSPEESNVSYQNQIANPTFTNTFLNPGIANNIVVSGADQVFPVGPDWDLVCTGTGTVVLQQVPITGNDNVVTNPPYVLDVTVPAGVTQCWLRQRFYKNSGLWTSIANDPVYLSVSLIAENVGSGSGGIQVFYSDSGNPDLQILSGTFGTSFVRLFGTSPLIPASNNPNSGNAGYVDIYLSFNLSSHTRVSSIQVIPVATPTPVFTQDFDSSNRNEALQGDYYIPRLSAKTMNSFLVGWDFSTNPFQFGASGNVFTAPTALQYYIVDQTIAQANVSNVAWTTNASSDGITFTTSTTNNAFYILQYLQGSDVQKMLGTRLSVNVFGYLANSINPVTVRIYLYRSVSTGTIPSLSTGTIGTVNSSGVFALDVTRGANWQAIPRSGLPDPQFQLSTVSNDAQLNSGNNDYGFSGWEITNGLAAPSTNDCFAMVVTFQYPNTGTAFTINSISLVPGDIPCRPSVQSPDEVLRQCQYYYEKSYNVAAVAGSTGLDGARTFRQIAGYGLVSPGIFRYVIYPTTIEVEYRATKRRSASLTFYSPNAPTTDGAQGAYIIPNGTSSNTIIYIKNFTFIGTSFSLILSSENNFTLRPNSLGQYIVEGGADNPTAQTLAEAYIQFNYVADARLGIVI